MRHLADGNCDAAADMTISSEVTRQVYDTNGTIQQYLVRTMTGYGGSQWTCCGTASATTLVWTIC
jgi:hypothetical protein